MLTDLPTLKTYLRITDAGQDSQLEGIITGADLIVKRYCKQQLEMQVQTRFVSGHGQHELAMRQVPIQAPRFTATLTNGSNTVTIASGLPNPGALLAGMPVIALVTQTQGTAGNYSTAIPVGALIGVVNATAGTFTMVDLNGNPVNATASGTFTLLCGLTVYLDLNGMGGDGPGSFAPSTQLIIGVDYALRRDQPDGSSKSGILYRLSQSIVGGNLAGFWPSDLRRGSLTMRLPPVWEPGIGNIKVVYTTGYPAGSTPDLTLACNMVCQWLRVTTPHGTPIQSESMGNYLWQLMNRQKSEAAEVGTIRDILSHYRDVI
jgi:hypothetical protein